MEIKGFTDLEQSKKLAEILPLESADMCYIPVADDEKGDYLYNTFIKSEIILREDDERIECWSLAALLDVLDYEIVDEKGVSYFLNFYKEDIQYQLCYRYELDTTGEDDIWTDSYDDFVDACYEMILKLHELKML